MYVADAATSYARGFCYCHGADAYREEFCTLAFEEAGISLRWEGEGVEEKGIDIKSGKVLVEVDPKYFRPAEVEQLMGDPSKAKNSWAGIPPGHLSKTW